MFSQGEFKVPQMEILPMGLLARRARLLVKCFGYKQTEDLAQTS